GVRTVTLSTGGTPVMKNITINAAPAPPTLTGISPSSGPQNGFLTTTLTGTNFVDGGTVVNVSGAGVVVSNVVFVSSTTMTAFLALSDASPRTVSVTTAGGTSATVPFTIASNLLTSAAHFAVSHFAGSIGGNGS